MRGGEGCWTLGGKGFFLCVCVCVCVRVRLCACVRARAHERVTVTATVHASVSPACSACWVKVGSAFSTSACSRISSRTRCSTLWNRTRSSSRCSRGGEGGERCTWMRVGVDGVMGGDPVAPCRPPTAVHHQARLGAKQPTAHALFYVPGTHLSCEFCFLRGGALDFQLQRPLLLGKSLQPGGGGGCVHGGGNNGEEQMMTHAGWPWGGVGGTYGCECGTMVYCLV